MHFNRYFILIVILSLLTITKQSFSSEDPFVNLNYNQIFNQEDIYQKHNVLLEKLGCDKNAFSEKKSNKNSEKVSLKDNYNLEKKIQEFEVECYSRLNNARRNVLLAPFYKEIIDISKMGITSCVIAHFLGKDNFGGSDNIAMLIANSIYSLYSLAFKIKDLISWPDNPYDYLEDYFAKNKCYIPRALWPKILRSFYMLHRDEFSRENHKHFLEFVLPFTIYKHKPEIIFKEGMAIEEVKNELNNRIDKFFQNYKNIDTKSLVYIKLNLSKFIDSLVDNHGQAVILQSRYIFLHGTFGIGKTHFVQTLSEWIEELIPNSVLFENMIINSSEELEGNSEKAGAFLKVFREQLLEKKYGSVIIIDEASWLNNPEMSSCSKRIFNGDRTRLATNYFGTEIDGSAVTLDIPPMLIFVTSNENIKEPALESRFDTIVFPEPNEKSLIEYTHKLISESEILSKLKNNINLEEIDNWVKNLEEKNRNYRYLQSNIEAFILTKIKNI